MNANTFASVATVTVLDGGAVAIDDGTEMWFVADFVLDAALEDLGGADEAEYQAVCDRVGARAMTADQVAVKYGWDSIRFAHAERLVSADVAAELDPDASA